MAHMKVLEEPEPEIKMAKPIPVQTMPVETFTPKDDRGLLQTPSVV